MTNIYIVIVNWNSAQDVLELIPTLEKIKSTHYALKNVVVENGSTDNSPQLLSKNLPKSVKYIDTGDNLGYAGGVNTGSKWSLEQGADFVFVLNPDTTVAEDIVDELLMPFSNDPQVGITGPRIYYYNDRDLIWWTGAKLNLWFGKIVNIGFKRRDSDIPKNITEADYIAGTAMLIKRGVFEKIGFFDQTFFHTSEETDYCLRARKAGFKLLVNPKAKVWHKIGVSSGGEYGPIHMYYMDRNRLFLMKKHGYWIPILSWLLVAPLLAKRFLASVIRGKNIKSAVSYLEGIRDFIFDRKGQKQ